MSDFTISMDSSKYLTVTSPNVNLYQGDNYVDTFSIFVPKTYGDNDLTKFTATFQYKDESNNTYVDILIPDDELYNDTHIRYRLPITTNITKKAGKLKCTLDLNYVDREKLIQYSLHSSETIITIHNTSDYYKFSDTSLNKIDQMIGKLTTKADYINTAVSAIAANTPDDLGIDEDGKVKLSVKTVLVGNGVDVSQPSTPDDADGEADGIVNLEEIYKNVNL